MANKNPERMNKRFENRLNATRNTILAMLVINIVVVVFFLALYFNLNSKIHDTQATFNFNDEHTSEKFLQVANDFGALQSNLGTLQSNFDTLNYTLKSNEKQRVWDFFQMWVLTLNETSFNKLLETITTDIALKGVDLSCISDSTNFYLAKEQFRFDLERKNRLDRFDIAPDKISCWKNFREVDCRQFCSKIDVE